MEDCLIVGGGVIGLSLAYDLARHGLKVRLLDRRQPGREASWAGAGILPPTGAPERQTAPLDQLAALSFRLHAEWSQQLLAETGIDNHFHRCGGWYLVTRSADPHNSDTDTAESRAADPRATDEFDSLLETCPPRGIALERPGLAEVAPLEPSLAAAVDSGHIRRALFLPDESQLRNPRHLQALVAACHARGVVIETGVEVTGFWSSAGQLVGAQTSSGPKYAGSFCLTAGAWSGALGRQLGIELPIRPVRGQIVLFRSPQPLLRSIVNVGLRYLVPRRDGRTLVGSTEEEAGFDQRTTPAALADLRRFALDLVPDLAAAEVEKTWAGLRPATADGLPYIGRLPHLTNVFVAAGHFRSGLYLSPATATLLSQEIRHAPPAIDPHPFRPDR